MVELLACLLEARGLRKVGDRLGVADASHDVLALSVDEEVAVALVGAVSRVAREGDAGCGGVALVAEDHDLDVHGRAEIVGNLVLLAVEDCARRVPGAEDCLLCKAELQVRIGREDSLAALCNLGVLLCVDVVGEDLLEGCDEVLEIVCVELGVELDTLFGLLGVDGILEELAIHAHDDVREHLDETTIGVPCEARVLGLLDEALDGVIVETEVQDRVHHARHRERCTGTDGDKQRILLVAELLAHALLEILAVDIDLVENAIRPHVASTRVGDAGLAGNRESWRDRKTDVCHLCKVCTLAARNPLRFVNGLACDLGHIVAVGVLAEAIHMLLSHSTP